MEQGRHPPESPFKGGLPPHVAQGLLECPQCGAALGPGVLHADSGQSCSYCGATVRLAAFPAARGEILEGGYGEPLEEESESSCFHHSEKRAVVPCDACGRFLCSLCDIAMRGKHYCSACLEAAIREGRLPELQTEYTRYDVLALTAACLPFMLFVPVALFILPFNVDLGLGAFFSLLFFPTLITAPIALYVALRYRKRTDSPLGRHGLPTFLAIFLASAEFSLWVAVIVAFAGALI